MKVSKVVFVLGLCLAIAGLGSILWRLGDRLIARLPVVEIGVEPGEFVRSGSLRVSGERARLGLRAEVASPWVGRVFGARRYDRYLDLYRYPARLRVLDAEGRRLFEQWVVLDSTRGQALRPDVIDKGVLLPQPLEARFDPFPLPADGRIRLELKLYPDSSFDSRIIEPRFVVYRQPPPLGQSLIDAGLLTLAGLATVLLSLLMELLAGYLRAHRPPRRLPSTDPVPTPQRPRQTPEQPLPPALPAGYGLALR